MRRKHALIGGTTTAGDCLTALRLLTRPDALVDGEATARWERAFAGRAGVRHARSFATGRVSLLAILRALGVGAGDEVLVQAPTHIVVANAIVRSGARAVFVDCLPHNWNIDPLAAARSVTPRTKALVLQHSYGIPADLDCIREITERHRIALVEDCVHALGATWDGRPVGSFGRAAFFSTEDTKMISTTMGGMAVTDDAEIAAGIDAEHARYDPPLRRQVARHLLKLVMFHVLTTPEVHRFVRPVHDALGDRGPMPATTDDELRGQWPAGIEQRFSAAQAELGMRQLDWLDENVAHRRRVAARYQELLGARGFPLVGHPEAASPSWCRYPVLVPDRATADRATRHAVSLGTWFSSVVQEGASWEAGGYEPGTCPQAERAVEHLANLPTNPRVREDDIERIVAALPGPPAW